MEQSNSSLERGRQSSRQKADESASSAKPGPHSTELAIHVIPLYKWCKAWRLQGEVVPASQKDPEGWISIDKFTVVLETAGLNGTELGGYSREPGLFPEQVVRRRQVAQDANAQPLLTMVAQKDLRIGTRSISERSNGSSRNCAARTRPWRRRRPC